VSCHGKLCTDIFLLQLASLPMIVMSAALVRRNQAQLNLTWMGLVQLEATFLFDHGQSYMAPADLCAHPVNSVLGHSAGFRSSTTTYASTSASLRVLMCQESYKRPCTLARRATPCTVASPPLAVLAAAHIAQRRSNQVDTSDVDVLVQDKRFLGA
jgi:hypothetical protein